MSGSFTRIGRLLASAAAFWLLAAVPAWGLAGSRGLEGLTYATVLCSVPGAVALFVASVWRNLNPVAVPLVGMALRLVLVLVGTIVLKQFRRDLGLAEFYTWLILAYLVTLAVETRLLLSLQQKSGGKPTIEGPGFMRGMTGSGALEMES